MQYGKAIRALRLLRGLSQKSLATLSARDASYISLVEAGRRQPSTQTLEAIADSLDVPLHLLMMLAAERKDLRGISQEEAATLGKLLLGILDEVKPGGG